MNIRLHNLLCKTERQEGSGRMCRKQHSRDNLMYNVICNAGRFNEADFVVLEQMYLPILKLQYA